MNSPATLVLGGLISIAALAAIWMMAYRVGFSEGRLTVPLRLITSLVDHKVNCLHERPDRVALEMHLLLDLPQQESHRIVERAAGHDTSLVSVPTPLSH